MIVHFNYKQYSWGQFILYANESMDCAIEHPMDVVNDLKKLWDLHCSDSNENKKKYEDFYYDLHECREDTVCKFLSKKYKCRVDFLVDWQWCRWDITIDEDWTVKGI